MKVDEPSTAPSLLERAQRDDSQAWHNIVRIYGPMIHGWARGMGLGAEDAADVMQAVFFAISRNLTRYQVGANRSNFRGWLWTITRNKVRDHLRALQGHPIAPGGSTALRQLQAVPVESRVEEDSDAAAKNLELRRAWFQVLRLAESHFEPQTWRAFQESVIKARAPRDVAEDLGISIWAVYKARSRVLATLRAEFAELIPGRELQI